MDFLHMELSPFIFILFVASAVFFWFSVVWKIIDLWTKEAKETYPEPKIGGFYVSKSHPTTVIFVLFVKGGSVYHTYYKLGQYKYDVYKPFDEIETINSDSIEWFSKSYEDVNEFWENVDGIYKPKSR